MIFSLRLESEHEDSAPNGLLPPRQERSSSNISQTLGTPMSVFEDEDRVNDYERQADEIVQEVWKIFQDNNGWAQESKQNGGIDVVMSKVYPKVGKVFRLSVNE